MNLVILIDSAQMFFRNLGLRHVKAALGLAIGLAAPNAGQKIIARFARPVEWLRSRLRPQVPEKSIGAQIQSPLQLCAAVGFPPTIDCCAGRHIQQHRTGSVFHRLSRRKDPNPPVRKQRSPSQPREIFAGISGIPDTKGEKCDDSNSAKNGSRSADWRGAHATRTALNCTNH